MQENVAIAVIIIVLFIILAIAGWWIHRMRNQVAFSREKRAVDEESGGEVEG
ncbi:hypothetical protein BO94DRAFT_533331 [Aspergillus sclerotioniger CBS 115572]|uniref:Uncharacterized protein n=1 Tax=Aspergillus sclerotioniger CBS 115572 TaxID=1450535 RepID=A0A317WZV4_9EURO|nr:hypothetical protein BO94DRAFT_533331 [Aspergillus sclerotioniger CBS 115572]PWY91893.1 hypothetical protein BO94DRAFT_533331 [Aspergillus sclerotioniger CBS 115572]